MDLNEMANFKLVIWPIPDKFLQPPRNELITTLNRFNKDL
jgi:hypothetical protein